MTTFKLVAICGKAGSGKDTLLRRVVAEYPNFNEIISCTTRPPREGEVNGVNYHFLTNEEFVDKMYNMEMLECTVFNDWCYGTPITSLSQDKVNIGVFNLEGIEILLEDPRLDITVFYIHADPKERLLRQLHREENPNVDEIIRRYSADEEDFKFIEYRLENNYTFLINNNIKDLAHNIHVIGQKC